MRAFRVAATRGSTRPIVLLISAFLGAGIVWLPASTRAADVADKRAEAARIQTRIDAQAERIAAADRALRLAWSDREDAVAEVRAAEARLSATQQALEAARSRLAARAVDAYVHGGRVSIVEQLTDTDGTDLEVRRHYINTTVRDDRNAIDAWEQIKEELEEARARVREAQLSAQAAVEQIDRDRDALAAEESSQRGNLQSVQGELGTLIRRQQERALADALRRRQPAPAPRRTTPTSPPPPTSTTIPPPNLGGIWACIREKESGNNYRAPGGGAYQFQLPTWQSLGGTGLPEDAPPEVQDAMAIKLQQRSGWSQWSTAKACGAY